MPLKFYLMVLGVAILAAALTIWIASVMSPDALWAGPGTMAVLATLALGAHFWMQRK